MYYLQFIEIIQSNKKIGEYVAQKGDIHVEVHDYLLNEVYNFIIKDTSRDDLNALNCFVGVNPYKNCKCEKIMFHYTINFKEIYEKLLYAKKININ